jgi:hypothetical protein
MANLIIPASSCEMTIKIIPRGYSQWSGTCAQFIDEGLVPAGFIWPAKANRVCWDAEGFSYWLGRKRPPGMKGPMRDWVEGDYWFVRRSITGSDQSYAPPDLYAKEQALKHAIWRESSDGRRAGNLWCAARNDERFQSLLKNVGAVKQEKRRGRKARDAGKMDAAGNLQRA